MGKRIIVRGCIKCRKSNARKMQQVMAALPKSRLVPYKPAFSYTGVDLFGPLAVKWGRLCTCLTTRGVYLDIVQADDFILLLRQFISRRGPPEELRSDNGSNFTSADRELTEAILNSRPLCQVSEDPQDMEASTPNHFLLHRKVTGLPPGIFVKEDGLLRKEWRKVQFLLQLFWQRWNKEYLPGLQPREKWFKEQRNVQEGDLVLLAEDNLKRNQWPMGRV
jgi:hypothetical protein